MDRFLIATTSGRALAQSAQDAGYLVDVFDLFGDWDLQKSVAEASPTGTPQTLVFSARNFRDLFELIDITKYRAAIIGGGLESKIDLVRRLGTPVLGCQSSQLERLQSHACLEVIPELVERSGARWPITQTIAPQNCPTSAWLLKSLQGSGGTHVQPWPASNPCDPHFVSKPSCVFQQYIEGFHFSALFAAQGNIRRRDKRLSFSSPHHHPACHLIGCSQQLVGEPVFGARLFAYCGSIAPLHLSEALWKVVERLGSEISSEFEIDGLFGIDLIGTEEEVWLIEINPRIPASAELYERLAKTDAPQSFSIFGTHVDACFGRNETKRTVFRAANRCVAKGILFCKSEIGLMIDETIFSQLERLYLADPGSARKIADIPHKGTRIEKGEPVLTFFVEADSASAAHRELFQFADQLNQLMGQRGDS